MSTTTTRASGALAHLGAWTARRRRTVTVAWLGAAAGLGALAPFADRALSGAGWEAPASESIAARHGLDSDFSGRRGSALPVVVTTPARGPVQVRAAAELARVRALLAGDPDVSGVHAPRAATSA